ncbi:MAG: hypothetical protein H0U23_05555 [Blastocatellia bacterium]|nr:hypothetical protein [Blastocatellia bacterium]
MRAAHQSRREELCVSQKERPREFFSSARRGNRRGTKSDRGREGRSRISKGANALKAIGLYQPEHWLDCIAWAVGAMIYAYCLLTIFGFPMQEGLGSSIGDRSTRPWGVLDATFFSVAVSL